MTDAGNRRDGPPPDGSGSLHAGFLAHLPIDGASVSVVTLTGGHSTVSSSDAMATHLEQVQFDLGEGPHWWALRTREPVLVPDVRSADHSRWPMFGHAVADEEVAGVFSFPLDIGAVTVGVVDLYRLRPEGLSDFHIARAVALSRSVASRAVQYAATDADGDGRDDTALVVGLRREVHQATGMVAVQLGVSATEAFSRLRGHAYATGRTVNEAAHDVVTRRIDFRRPPI